MSFEIKIEQKPDSGLFDQTILNYNQHYFSAVLNFPEKTGQSQYTIHHRNGGWEAATAPATRKWAEPAIKFLASCEGRPWIIINGTTDVLGRVRLSGRKLVLFEQEPIAIFLYEPIFFLKGDGSRQFWQPQMPSQIDFISVELDSILEFNEQHGGKFDITIYSCDHNLERLTKAHPRYKLLKVKTFDIFLTHFIYNLPRKSAPMSFRFAKKAICLNFRYDFFREIMIAFLREKNYHLRSFLTYYHSHHARTFSRLPLAFDNWKFSDTIRRGIDKMQPELPYTLEARGAQAVCPSAHAFPDIKLGINRRQESSIGKYYENSFVSIVNETRYFSYCPNVSEKTINSFFYFRPAILTAPPGSLEYLQTLGFKTFHEYWDESYDREMDHAQRFERIFSLLDKIFSLSQQKLEELLWEMQPILYHNRYRLLDFVDDQRNFIKKEQ